LRRPRLNIGLGAVAAAALSLAAAGGAQAQAKPVIPTGAPDLIIHNAKIVTVDGGFSIARAAAVKAGRFVAVGTDAAILRMAGPATQRIDMKGKTVLPGFNDTHVHVSGGTEYETKVDLTQVRSIADIQAALRARLATAAPGEWVVGSRGWWEYEMADGRLPTRADLDAVAPNNPVTIPGPHYAIANSMALRLAGITKDTPDPQGGEIWKDPTTGEPTGLLMDNASRAVSRFYPRATPAQQTSGMLKLLALINSNGLTSVGDPGGSPEDAAMYRKLYDDGKLTVRVDFSYSVDPAAPLAQTEAALKTFGPPGQHWGDGMFRSDELGEVGLDGAELSAMLRDDYPGKPGYKGIQKVPNAQFNQFAALANRYGWRLRPHAVGDRAIDEALEAFAFANKEKPLIWRRWMIDHAFLLLEDHLPKVKELGLIINSQYMHNAQLGQLIGVAWKKPLSDKSEQFKLWLDNGVMFANGSDGPISYDAVPLYQIYGSVTRKTQWGGQLGPDQGISREEAIKSVTINGAYTSFEENVKGSIEPGKYADFVVLSADVMTVPADTIKDIKVLATVLGGKTVFGNLNQ
jgi:predicted amidohydrolase YtcJ